MRESLKLLGVNSSGLNNPELVGATLKSDEEVICAVDKLVSNLEKENYLKNFLEKAPAGYIKSKRLLAELLKTSDPKYTCDLMISICQYSPLDPSNYLLFAEVAVANNAWRVAADTLNIVKWVCLEKHSEEKKKSDYLNKLVLNKLSENEKDNSNNEFWHNKSPDKFWILEKLFFHAKIKDLIDFSFKLLHIFPGDLRNYDVVYKAFSLIEDKEPMNNYIQHVKSNLKEDKLNQNLYLGMAYYYLSDFKSSIACLTNVLSVDNRNQKALFYLALNYLMNNNPEEFVLASFKIVSAIEPSYIALYFISSAMSNLKLDKIEFPNQKNISREASVIIEKLIRNKQDETVYFLINQFKKLEYFLILPYLQLYLSEVLIRNNDLLHAKEILNGCNDFDVHRLMAWIYRLEGNDKLAESELIKYRQKWIPDKDRGLYCQLVDLNLPTVIPDEIEKMFGYIKEAYKQTKELIQQFDLEYGLNAMTCIEAACQDCCKKTFPYISYIEYLYMKNWLDSQSEEYKNHIYQQSIEIVNKYRKMYKKDPPFMCGENIDQKKEYPHDLTFNCPYLGDNKCTVYEARPFTCRAYSYASQDGVKYKGCNYFYEQLKGATKLNDIRKVINMASFFNFAKLIDEKLIGKRIIAPIPVWFAQSHEETLEKIKNVTRD